MTHRGAPEGARVVVVGAGFAGASLLRSLPPALRRPGETLLVDRKTEFPFLPLLHEVAAGRVHPHSVLSPIAPLCEGRCGFLNAEVTGVDPEKKVLETSSGEVRYEHLVLTAGSVAVEPPQRLEDHFQTFWTPKDALKLRDRLNDAWNTASGDGAEPGELTVAIVGGGTTGVELAAEIAALFRYLKRRTARRMEEGPRVVLLEATGRLMGWLDPYFHRVAIEELSRLGVEVRLNTTVEEANGAGVGAGEEWLPARTCLWAAGVEAPPLIRGLPTDHDASGRARVGPHLTLPDYPDLYVLGDGALYKDPRWGDLPPTASVAVQQGPWTARDLGRRLRNGQRPPFDFFNRGYVVSLGPESAVAEALGVKLKGATAQALYRSVLLYYMNRRWERVMTFSDWAMERSFGRLGFDPGASKRRSPAR